MPRALAPGLLLALAVASCHAPVPVTHKASPAPTARVAAASPTPTPAPALSEGPTTAITGTVRLEPGYLISEAGGSLVGGHVQLPAGSLIGEAGGGLLSDQGLGLLSDQGSGLLANNAGNLVANNAGNLLAPNGASFHLAAAPSADLLPVAGMAIVPIDLANGRVLGRVFYTDAAGAFTARVPAGLAGNPAFAAVVPARKASDAVLANPRLAYALVVAPGTPAVLDEDTAVVTAYLRGCFAGRLELALGSDDFDATLAALAGARTLTGPLKASVLDLAKQLRARALAAGVDKRPAADRQRLARRVAAALLAHVDLAAIKLDASLSPGWKGPAEPALAALVTVMAALRTHAAERLAADPKAFAAKPYLGGATLARAADLADFVVKTYLLGSDSRGLIQAGEVLADVGAGFDEQGLEHEERLRAAYYATVAALAQTLLIDEGARADVFRLIDQP